MWSDGDQWAPGLPENLEEPVARSWMSGFHKTGHEVDEPTEHFEEVVVLGHGLEIGFEAVQGSLGQCIALGSPIKGIERAKHERVKDFHFGVTIQND